MMDQLSLFPEPKGGKRSATPKRKGGKRQPRPQDIKVGRFFTLLDFLVSDSAVRHGVSNWCDWNSDRGQEIICNMQMLCSALLDPLCENFGNISVSRGFLGEDLFRWIYPKADEGEWPKGALYHGFANGQGGADILVHQWQGSALELALHIQNSPTYVFDTIRSYPAESRILCVGVGGRNSRFVMQWHPNFRGVDRYPFNQSQP